MDLLVRKLLAEQAGVISRGQALAVGQTRQRIDHLLATGEWVRVHPRVYRCDVVPPSAEQAVRAASLWADDGVLTGLGAAWWWQLTPDPPLRWEFLITGTSARAGQPRVRLLRRWVDPADVTVHRGLRVITPALAVLRSAVASEQGRRGHGVRLIDRMKQVNAVTSLELEGAFLRNRGTWGTTIMAQLLERTGDRAHSDLERLGISLLTEAGITGFVVNLTRRLSNGRTVELDVAFEEQLVGLEFDGYPYHSSPEAQEADARRQNDLVRDGWTILRFPPDELRHHRGRFIRVVRETLRRTSVDPAP